MQSSKIIIVPSKVNLVLKPRRQYMHYFSLGEIMQTGIFQDSDSNLSVNVNVEPDPAKHLKGPTSPFSTFYQIGDDSIYYQRKYAGILCCLTINNLTSNHIDFFVNPNYLRYVKLKMDNLYPAGIHLTDLLMLKILSAGDLILHGASLVGPSDQNGFAIVAPPDTGKTYTTYMLMKQNYKFLGEDLSYYDAATDSLICMPLTSTWGHRFSFSKLDIINKIPFLSLFQSSRRRTVTDIFGMNSIQISAPLKRLYFLEKSTRRGIEQIYYSEDLFRKVMAIQRNEFSYYKNPLLRSFEYFYPLNIDSIFAQEADTVRTLLSQKELLVAYGQSHEDFYQLIDAHEKAI